MSRILLCGLVCVLSVRAVAELPVHFSVGPEAAYHTIQAAIDASLSVPGPVLISIAPGQYPESLMIKRDKLALVGAGPEQTVIRFSRLRKDWVASHDSDWGAAVVNIDGSDIALLDLTIENSYGRIHGDNDHQFAVRLMQGTRIITDNCRIIAGGADTLSLWDKDKGMYYHSNCYFEGYVDMVCPRGWAYITGSHFYTRGGKYTLWHDGEKDQQQKLVVVDSLFDGEPNFQLGRRHYDAQFWLINARFTPALSQQPIFRKTYPEQPERDRPNLWGDRYFFRNAQMTDGSAIPAWAKDNMKGGGDGVQISARWAFAGRWDPEADLAAWRKAAAH